MDESTTINTTIVSPTPTGVMVTGGTVREESSMSIVVMVVLWGFWEVLE